jgi:hypothetical protein
VHGGGRHPERAVPGVPEPHGSRGLDPAVVADDVVAALAPKQARVDGDRAREALRAEGHAADGAPAPVPHRHLEHRVVPGLLPRVHRLHLHARRRALPCRRCWPRLRHWEWHWHRTGICTTNKSELRAHEDLLLVASIEKELTRGRFPRKRILYLGLAPEGGEEQGEEAASWTLPCSPYFLLLLCTLLKLVEWNGSPELVTLLL